MNSLPFERFDLFNTVVLDKYRTMLASIEFIDCPCSLITDMDTFEVLEGWESTDSEVCHWPTFHHDVKEILRGSYRGVAMGVLVQEENNPRSRAGKMITMQNLRLDVQDIVDQAKERAVTVTKFLLEGLEVRVYPAGEIELIQHIRSLLDLKNLMSKVSTFGPVHVSNTLWRTFLEASKAMEEDLVARVATDELRTQYREFHRRIHELSKVKGSEDFTNLDILGRFLDPKGNLYKV